MKASFRVGVRLGLLAGLVLAVVVALRSRRHGRAAAPGAGIPGDHHPHGRVTVPLEAAGMGAPPSMATRPAGPPEPEVPEPSEHLDSERSETAPVAKKAPAAEKASRSTKKASGKKKAAGKRDPAKGRSGKGADAPPWVAPEGKGCPASHPVKAKLASRLFHLPGMLAYERTNPDRCYIDATAAEADGLTQAKR